MIRLEELESYNNKNQSGGPLNKEVRKLKFQLLGLLSKGYNIIVYIYRLASRLEEFRKLTRRMILIDNYIR